MAKKKKAAKKKVVKRGKKKAAIKKAPAKKAPAGKKRAVKKKAVKASSTQSAAGPRRKAAKKKQPASAKSRATSRKPASLGRPKVTGEEKLYWLFQKDYHARQVFEFLRVETVRELEQFSPQEIIRRLSQPVRKTVESIRHELAKRNRHLADDLEFALQHQAQRQED